jgi:hypothetical protein
MIYQGTNLLDAHRRQDLFFDPAIEQISFLDKRYYKIKEDVYYPSVTTVLSYMPKNKFFDNWLKDVGHNADIILERASKEGTQVHNAAEDLINGKTVNWLDDYGNTRYSLVVWLMILRFAEFWRTYKPELVKAEGLIYSDTYKYAGRYDIVAKLDNKLWLLDIKTSNSLHKSYDLQLAAYIKAIKEVHDLDIEKAGIIWLKSSKRKSSTAPGVYQGKGWEVKEVDNIDHNFELFKHVHALYMEDNKDEAPNTIDYPTTISI